MNKILIIILALIVLAFVLLQVAYCVKKHNVTVVGILKTGVLAYLSEANEIIYVGNAPDRFKPIIGDVIQVRHSFCHNLKYRFGKAENKLPSEYIMLRGFETNLWDEEQRHDLKKAVLLNKLSTARWLAKQGDTEVFLETDGSEHAIGKKIYFLPADIHLSRFYYV